MHASTSQPSACLSVSPSLSPDSLSLPHPRSPCEDLKEPSDDRHQTSSTAAQKFAIYGFIPLASIAASPVCARPVLSPSLARSLSPDYLSPSDPVLRPNAYLPASRLHSARSCLPQFPSTAQAMTSSGSSFSSQRPSAPFSTSASFPASMIPHAPSKTDIGLKRGVSVPDMSPLCQISSKPFPSCKRARTSDGPVLSPLRTTNLPSLTTKVPLESLVTHQHLSPPDSLNHTVPSPGDIHFPEKTKDAIRKFHALKELLATEVGYLMDLRIFVTIYLRNLSTLTSRSPTTSTFRSSMSFTAGPWMNSYSHLQAATVSTSDSSSSLKDATKPSRSLLSDSEIETLSRNAEDILQFHQDFVNELRNGLSSLGYSMNDDENKEAWTAVDEYQGIEDIDGAIRVVTSTILSKAHHFKRYESFCAGHPEALELVKKTLHQHAAAWEAYGQRCSILVAGLLLASGTAVAPSDSPQNPLPDPMPNTIQTSNSTRARRRAISLTSSDPTIRPLRRKISGVLSKDALSFPADPRRERPARRIEFMDYMIKPVQRICKYPLLLDQLKQSKTVLLGPQRRFESTSDVDELVEKAAQTMRDVAASVDDARHRQDIATRSSLIISRIHLSGSLMAASSTNPSLQNLTLDFFSSLGNCLFAGSLDVLHHHPLVPLDAFSTVTAKYLGAFLYPGGYLILVKVSKGKKYEPKHWFSLVGFELADVEDDEAMLAFSFRLSSENQVYELGAGCRREKDAWMSAIRESSSQTATWINEPTPSFMFGGKGEYIPTVTESELKSGSETACNTDNECSENVTIRRRRTRMSMKPWRYDTISRGERPLTSGSVKAMFTPTNTDDEDIELRRSATTARSQINHDLQDVLSQSCLNARSYAFSREEELFPPPVSTRVPLPRSNSSMSISGMARLTRYDSVRIPKRKSTVDGSDLQYSQAKVTTLGSRRKAKQLSLNSLPPKECLTNSVEPYPTPPSSQASSTASSFVISYEPPGKATYLTSGSSTSGNMPSSTLARRGSIVQNVKQFLTSVSPMTALSSVKHTLSSPESRSNSRNQHSSLLGKRDIRTARRGHV